MSCKTDIRCIIGVYGRRGGGGGGCGRRGMCLTKPCRDSANVKPYFVVVARLFSTRKTTTKKKGKRSHGKQLVVSPSSKKKKKKKKKKIRKGQMWDANLVFFFLFFFAELSRYFSSRRNLYPDLHTNSPRLGAICQT